MAKWLIAPPKECPVINIFWKIIKIIVNIHTLAFENLFFKKLNESTSYYFNSLNEYKNPLWTEQSLSHWS